MSLGVGLALPLLATSVTLRFEHLGIEDGLSQNNAVGIVQDDQGFIWIGTQDGLNRFDGYQFKVFRRDPRRPESITHNYINQVLHSRDGTLWVGSRGGLHRFDPEADSFNNYGAREGLSDVNVTLLYEDRSGRLWVATERGGLGRFDPDEARFEPVGLDAAGQSSVQVLSLLDTYGHGLLIGTTRGLIGIDSDTGREIEVAGSMRLEGRQITALAQSGDDVLWIGTDQGLLSLDPDRSINSAQIESPGNGPRHDAIRTIFEDRHLNLWVGTRHGLIRRDQGTGEWQRHTPNQTSLGLSGNDIRVVFEDMSGVIWLGYDGSGIDRFNPTGIGFEHIGVGPDHPFGIGFPHVWAILPDSNGDLWIGSEGNGLSHFIRNDQRFEHLTVNSGLISNNVNALLEDRSGTIWVGTDLGGLHAIRPDSPGITRHEFEHSALRVEENNVYAFLEDQRGDLWIGTNAGVVRLNPTGEPVHRLIHDESDPRGLGDPGVRSLFEDHLGHIWIGTRRGLNVYDPTDGSVEQIQAEIGILQLGNQWILSIEEDRVGDLWLGTTVGLIRYRHRVGVIDVYDRNRGLPNDTVYATLIDDSGLLWLSTNNGLATLDPNSGFIETFDASQGLQANEFNQGAHAVGPDGRFYFGGVNGVTAFDPYRINTDLTPPMMVITDFRLFNQSVPVSSPDRNTPLSQPIHFTDHLVLGHQDNVISFEFAALHFGNPKRNQYRYRLMGLSDAWLPAPAEQRNATFTSLSPGQYTFEVNGSNQSGIWSANPARIDITVLPPWWQSYWAWAGYVLASLLALTGVIRWRTGRLKAMTAWLEENVAARTEEVERSYDNVRTLSQIGHEIVSDLDLESILNSLGGHIPRLVPADCFGIGIYDPDTQAIRYEMSFEQGKRYPAYSRPLADKNQLAVWCLKHRKPVVINDMSTDLGNFIDASAYVEIEKRLADSVADPDLDAPVCSEITLPLISKNQVLGVLTVQSLEPGVYTAQHVDLLQSLASYAASAIGNARAVDSVRRNEDALRALNEVVATVNRELEPKAVLASVLKQGMRLLPAAEKGLALTHSNGSPDFKVVAVEGFDLADFDGWQMDSKSAIEYYLTASTSVAHGIYLARFGESDASSPDPFPTPKSRLIIALTARHELAAFVVFDNFSDSDAFDQRDIRRLSRFRDHARSAMDKAELLSQTIHQQRQLAQSERLASLGLLTAGVAHEINNPTNFALAGAQNLQATLDAFDRFLRRLAGEDADPEVLEAISERFVTLRDQLELIIEGNRRIKNIVGDLQAFSRTEESELKRVNVEQLLSSTLRLAKTRYKTGVSFETQLDIDTEIDCHPGRLNQVFLNILVNACQAVEERARFDTAFKGRIKVVARERGRWCEVDITDNGAGMSEATRERIFEPFFTTKPVGSGTGLGLSISFAAVEELGGELVVDTKLGRGTTFTVRLPLPDAT